MSEDDERGRFCPWYLLVPGPDTGAARAPDRPGVYQVKRAHGLVDYPRGKSAMLRYGHADSLKEGVEALAAGLDADGRAAVVCRHQVTDDGAAAEALYRTLVEGFVTRFGAPLVGLEAVGAGRRPRSSPPG